ncbi:MAG: hypothetical protein J0H42_28805 [Rhizobiales bacterium]|nr:hypothetical protein [Hyphomicrobiales bacterium]
MTIGKVVRTLSSDELDAVSGGTTISGCTKNGGTFKFLGYKFTFYNCEEGNTAVDIKGPKPA